MWIKLTLLTGFAVLAGVHLSWSQALQAPALPGASGQADAFAEGLLALKQNQIDLALKQLTVAERQHPSDARSKLHMDLSSLSPACHATSIGDS